MKKKQIVENLVQPTYHKWHKEKKEGVYLVIMGTSILSNLFTFIEVYSDDSLVFLEQVDLCLKFLSWKIDKETASSKISGRLRPR